jgi:hypothetical protein
MYIWVTLLFQGKEVKIYWFDCPWWAVIFFSPENRIRSCFLFENKPLVFVTQILCNSFKFVDIGKGIYSYIWIKEGILKPFIKSRHVKVYVYGCWYALTSNIVKFYKIKFIRGWTTRWNIQMQVLLFYTVFQLELVMQIEHRVYKA